MIADCTAIILAGGDSQRMGFDKANMQIGSRTMLQHVIDTMQQIFPKVIVSVRQMRLETGLLQICDEHAGKDEAEGPLAGLLTSLEHITTPWAFVVACDMPYISSSLVEYLATLRSDYQAVVPLVQGHPQTLAAFYSKAAVGSIREHIEKGGKKSVRAALEKLHVLYVYENEILKVDPELRSFFDLDTPQDVIRADNLSH